MKRLGFLSFFVSLLCAVIGAGIGAFFAQHLPHYVKVSARFEAPKIADLGNYYSLLQTYTLVQNDGKTTPTLEQSAVETAYAEFQKALAAPDVKRAFLANHPTVKQIAEVYHQPVEPFAEVLAEKLVFDLPSNTLRFSLVNPTQATQVLNDFIALHTDRTRQLLNNDLISKWKFLFQSVKQSADANLGEIWHAKLKMMLSVQPLDNQLTPYRFQQTVLAEKQSPFSEAFIYKLLIGGGLGLLLGLFISLIFSRASRTAV